MKKLMILVLFIAFLTGCNPKAENLSIALIEQVDTIEINTNYEDLGAIGYYGPIKLDTTVVKNTLDVTKLGIYEITYEVIYGDLSKSITRYVTVVDETPPILMLNPGIDTIYLNDTWQDAYITVSDNSNGVVYVILTGSVLNEVGTYVITYTATDASGNSSNISRYVHVIEK